MDEGIIKTGLLLEAAQNQQKVAEASFEKLNALGKVLREIPREITPELKASIEGAVREELSGARQEVQLLTRALRDARTRLGQTLMYFGGGVVVIAVLAVAALFLWVMPPPGEIIRLRAERAALAASAADLAARGARIQLRNCANPGEKARLCARIDPTAGPYGTTTEQYRILAGY